MSTAIPSAQEGVGVERVVRSTPAADHQDQVETRIVREATGDAAQTAICAPDLPADLRQHPRYAVLEFLAAGGMGAVFKARHRLMGRLVALKVIHSHWAGEPAMVERFGREMRAAARLCHPNVVVAHDAEHVGTTHFLVMEFVQGQTLEDYIGEHFRHGAAGRFALPIAQVCDYVRQAAEGLQHAHERGVVHHDIKPHNLMLTPTGQIKILDFGLARFADRAEPGAVDIHGAGSGSAEPMLPYVELNTLTDDAAATPCWRGRKVEEVAAGYPMGTVDYLAPEEFDDPRRADIRGDIYSLGCTLYRCLTGQVPFPGCSLVQKLKAHRRAAPAPVDRLRPETPAALASAVARMIAKDPDHRYQTPAEVAQALLPFAGSGAW